MPASQRLSTGIPRLDDLLDGGLLPGTLAVILGATGIGKTQLGIQFLNAGLKQEGERGVLFDLTSRGDSQNHADYAERIAGWRFARCRATSTPRPNPSGIGTGPGLTPPTSSTGPDGG